MYPPTESVESDNGHFISASGARRLGMHILRIVDLSHLPSYLVAENAESDPNLSETKRWQIIPTPRIISEARKLARKHELATNKDFVGLELHVDEWCSGVFRWKLNASSAWTNERTK